MWNSRVRSLQDQKYSKAFKDFFCLFSKTFEGNQLSKNYECKHHFYPVISPVKSHSKMRIFVDICGNLIDSINLFYQLEKRIINSSLKNLKTFKDFLRFFTQFKDFSKISKTCIFKDFQGFLRPLYEP
jgi:hypothetical protein